MANINIYESINALITSEIVSEISASFKEDSTNIRLASESAIAGLLFSIPPKEGSSEVETAIRKAGTSYPYIRSKFTDIFTGKADETTYYLGFRFLESLFGNRVNTFTSLISHKSGLSIRNTDKLLSMISPVVAAYLGNIILTEKTSFATLLREIENEKDSYQNFIPSQLSELLEISGIGTSEQLPFSIDINNPTNIPSEQLKIKRGFDLGKWITILIAIAVLIFWWRSCI
ncbi:DUF937 domain-containing protein [Dysgonomonas sp. OttesenSCG-928-M03]|nr:DUF937 domain-containing protein [Dysgonomonas sp. OttesenSCG-928-M03]